MLKQYGYDLEVDCKFGDKTKNAVKDFQRINGLDADGIVGQKTWKMLLKR